jgi:hypothetical protein
MYVQKSELPKNVIDLIQIQKKLYASVHIFMKVGCFMTKSSPFLIKNIGT